MWQTIGTTLAGLNWTAIAGVVGSVAPLATILIAYRALGSWKRTLQNQRVDECISATFSFKGSVDRYIAVKRRARGGAIHEVFDQLWASFRDFGRAYTVACRYHPELYQDAPFKIQKLLINLGDGEFSEQAYDIDEQLGGVLNDVIEKLHTVG
jgi:hypothetical protein